MYEAKALRHSCIEYPRKLDHISPLNHAQKSSQGKKRAVQIPGTLAITAFEFREILTFISHAGSDLDGFPCVAALAVAY